MKTKTEAMRSEAAKYVKSIRNAKKKAYAEAYLAFLESDGVASGRYGPDYGDLSYIAAQGVRISLHKILEW